MIGGERHQDRFDHPRSYTHNYTVVKLKFEVKLWA